MDVLHQHRKKILLLLFFLVLVLVFGVFGYSFLESVSLETAFELTARSAIGLYGYKSTNSFTVLLTGLIMILEWACVWLAFETAVRAVVEGRVGEILGDRRMRKQVLKMNGHYVLCGYGRVGREVLKELLSKKKSVVVVERDARAIEDLSSSVPIVEGDLMLEETLNQAGVQKAGTLIAALGSDSDNVFLTLAAKQLNPKIRVIARAERQESVSKLKQAGASEVIMPSAIGGRALASVALKT